MYSVPFDHRRIDLEDYDDVYVVGDVHGCLDALERLLSTLNLGENDLAIFVGDLVRKVPSVAVLERVRRSPKLCSVRGNNEQKLLEGDASLSNFGRAEYEYVESLPLAISWDGGLVVHGGVDPNRELTAHSSRDVLTMRSPNGDGYDGPFWFDAYEGRRGCFRSHSPRGTTRARVGYRSRYGLCLRRIPDRLRRPPRPIYHRFDDGTYEPIRRQIRPRGGRSGVRIDGKRQSIRRGWFGQR